MNEPNAAHSNIATPKQHKPINQRLSFWVIILLVVLVAAFLYRHTSTAPVTRGSQKMPVVTASVKTANVPVYINALGSVTPTHSVTVMTQINGILMRVLFQEGQIVKAGDLLAEIDSRPYEALLLEYEGQLKRDQALLANALIDLKRYQTLWKQDSISEQTLATQQALVNQLKGTIQLDEGLIQTTKVNLVYCKITSPVDGRIGLRLIDPGNLVQTSDTTGIAVVNTLNPITVVFAIPEDNIPEVMQKMDAQTVLSVEAFDRQQNKLLATGKLLAVDSQINSTTGTVNLKAQFVNDKNVLFPSQFVNIRLLINTLKNAIVVPTAAIQQSTKGTFVYVLNTSTLTVKEQIVKTGVTINDTTVVDSGVSPGQIVITQGADQLTDGATVILPGSGNPANATQSGNEKRHVAA